MPPKNATTQRYGGQIFAEYSLTVKTYSTMGALHTMAEYWVENEIIIERAAKEEADLNAPQWSPDVNDEQSMGKFFAERDLARYKHDNTLIPMHRYSCVVMLYTTVERELRRLIENLEKERGVQKLQVNDIREKSYLAQVGKFVAVFHGIKFSDCQQYLALCDLQKIRDCIIHCHGEVALSRDKKDLVNLWRGSNRRNNFAAPEHGSLCIGEECMRQFLIEAWSFFVWVFNALNWQIAGHWQGDVLGEAFKNLKK